jgi:hypothetical protein
MQLPRVQGTTRALLCHRTGRMRNFKTNKRDSYNSLHSSAHAIPLIKTARVPIASRPLITVTHYRVRCQTASTAKHGETAISRTKDAGRLHTCTPTRLSQCQAETQCSTHSGATCQCTGAPLLAVVGWLPPYSLRFDISPTSHSVRPYLPITGRCGK